MNESQAARLAAEIKNARAINHVLNLKTVQRAIAINPDCNVGINCWGGKVEIDLTADLTHEFSDSGIDVSDYATEVRGWGRPYYYVSASRLLRDDEKVRITVSVSATQQMSDEDVETLKALGKLVERTSTDLALICR